VSIEYQVTPVELGLAATNCHTTAADIQGELASLRTYVEVLGASWLGLASGTFQHMMVDFHAYAENLRSALDNIGNGLQGNFVNYVEMEQANIAALTSVDGLNLPLNLGSVPSTSGPGGI
jgi:WXG100 family type VII secretion target